MNHYIPVIRRAIARWKARSPQEREAIYVRARTALNDHYANRANDTELHINESFLLESAFREIEETQQAGYANAA